MSPDFVGDISAIKTQCTVNPINDKSQSFPIWQCSNVGEVLKGVGKLFQKFSDKKYRKL